MCNFFYYSFISTTELFIQSCISCCFPAITWQSKCSVSTDKIFIPLVSGDLASDFLSIHDDEASDSWSSQLIPRLPYKAQADPEVDGLAGEGPESLAFIRPARSLISDEVLEALRTSDRKGRDVVVGLSNACCKWGCSKSEISSLC